MRCAAFMQSYAILCIRQSGNPGKLSNAHNCHKRLPKCPKCPQLPPKRLKCKIPQNYQNQCSKGGKMGHWNFLCLCLCLCLFPVIVMSMNNVSYQLIRDAKLSPNLAPKMRKLCHNLICDKTA